MSVRLTRRYCVRGRVQGVFYRASARTAALGYGLSGWVRNRCDSTVEVEATGTATALEEFEAWLWQGPPTAKVTEVIVENRDLTVYSDFEIRR